MRDILPDRALSNTLTVLLRKEPFGIWRPAGVNFEPTPQWAHEHSLEVELQSEL